MVVDFSRINLQEPPTLILKNAADEPIGVLGTAFNTTVNLKYNEVSEINFDIPMQSDGVATPYYDSVTGMRVVELQDIGQFILINPSEVGDGIKKVKSCKGYSLEYQFTFKKIVLENATYNFWNPVAPSSTILNAIMELMPSWSIGHIDSELIGKYRTFEVDGENLYNFIKNTLQTSYNCIFDFDTMNKVVNVISASSTVPINPVYLSQDNLIKQIEITENTDNLVTKLDVSGAEGVAIRDVNPSGTNYIINIDYFMDTGNFSKELKEKYYEWRALYKSRQQEYYNLSVEYSIQIARKVAEEAALKELEAEMTNLENQQAITIQSIAMGLQPSSELVAINNQITDKRYEIDSKKEEISDIEEYADEIFSQISQINEEVNFKAYFSEDEYVLLDKYIREDAVSDSSFVVKETSSYSQPDISNRAFNGEVSISNSKINHVFSENEKHIYDIVGGNIVIDDMDGMNAEVIKAAFEYDTDRQFVMTAYLGAGSIGKNSSSNSFKSACLTMTGTADWTFEDATPEEGSSDLFNATGLYIHISSASVYFTLNTSDYEKKMVAWELYEYGREILEKISQPSYTFNITSANFLCLEDFVLFKNSLKQGQKVYVSFDDDKTLSPIVTGISISYDSINEIELEFSNTFTSMDSSFRLADLLEQSISMGSKVDLSKFTYSAFIDSGANTQVKSFMDSAIDISKNALFSSKNQAISWGDSGIRLRKWADEQKVNYDPKQIWMNNNSILMTSDDWNSAEIAIGNFHDPNIGDVWGIIAPHIVGTLLAGNNLVIESQKQDGGIAVFKVDAEGCRLHNSDFSITTPDSNTHILLNAEHGIAIGTYPLIDEEGKIDENRSKFWVSTDGSLYFKGTLKGADGEFTGKITANSGYIGGTSGWTIESGCIYNGKNTFNSYNSGVYIGTDGISLGTSYNYIRLTPYGTLEANNVMLSGNIIATSGTIGGCDIINGTLNVNAANIFGTLDANMINVTNLNASSITTGTLDINRIPNLTADKITSGTLNANLINVTNLNASNITVGTLTAERVDGLPASKITSGTFSVNRIPNLSADKITTGQLSANRINVDELWSQILSSRYGTFSGAIGVSPNGVNVTAMDGYAVIAHRGGIGYQLTPTGVVTYSDMRLKQNIRSIPESYIEFFDKLNPVLYNFINDKNSTRVGLIAQECEEAMIESGLSYIDFNGVIKPQGDDDYYMIIPEAFSMLAIAKIQQLEQRLKIIENAILSFNE